MPTIDEIEELRAELRYTHLTATERCAAETRLAQLLVCRELARSWTLSTLDGRR